MHTIGVCSDVVGVWLTCGACAGLAGSTSAKVAFSPLCYKPMKRVDTVELDLMKCTTIIPPRAWGTGDYTLPPAKAVYVVFGVHGGHVATCQSGSRLCARLSLLFVVIV